MSESYQHPEVLVETDWVAQHLNDPKVRIVESDEDVLLYDVCHVPGFVKIGWHTYRNDPVIRDYLDADRFAALLAAKVITASLRPFSSAATAVCVRLCESTPMTIISVLPPDQG